VTAPERLIYIARRNPAYGHEQWVGRWRDHWALAASQPEIEATRRYIQCEILFDAATPPRDGIAITEYRSPGARRAIRSATGFRAVMQADERRVFDRLVVETMLIARHHVIHGAGAGPFKVVRFVTRGPGLSREEFLHAWRAEYAPGAAASPDLLGYAQDHPLEQDHPSEQDHPLEQDHPTEPDGSSTWSLAADGVEEFWFADLSTCRTFLESPRLATLTDSAGLFAAVDAVVTDEVVLRCVC
jgi:hypothetical protein